MPKYYTVSEAYCTISQNSTILLTKKILFWQYSYLSSLNGTKGMWFSSHSNMKTKYTNRKINNLISITLLMTGYLYHLESTVVNLENLVFLRKTKNLTLMILIRPFEIDI